MRYDFSRKKLSAMEKLKLIFTIETGKLMTSSLYNCFGTGAILMDTLNP